MGLQRAYLALVCTIALEVFLAVGLMGRGGLAVDPSSSTEKTWIMFANHAPSVGLGGMAPEPPAPSAPTGL